MPTQRMSLVWVDATGGSRMTTLTTRAGATTVAAALVAKSNGDVAEDWEGALQVAMAPVTTAAAFQSTRDVASLIFSTVGGTLVTVFLPAPLLSIFLADKETVDATKIAAIIAAVVANVTDAAGNAVVSFVGGTRQK